ncbi:23S rRNA (adenine(1618)-N(6))-methyltransferase RlmF [Portibacter marinus]|uniref:23S rRNA (adenine(1618)-N(6))-methyltransferase RlmF n=1 Tax=Portibacter marinus TaxID=2898660 RepID=UPI001F29683B|nr:23S rRNA (adenine(1618)-N(6))-methyltransferase RlmF [Portibacter marinus]
MKSKLHPRNKHRGRYDLESLVKAEPELGQHIFINDHGVESIDFFNPEAVKLLNRSLLIKYYGIQFWDIPDGYLCPPIPGRADYIHHLADLLGQPKGSSIKVLDIGSGANCIFPIIGHQEYGWSFVGSELDETAYLNALKIVEENSVLKGNIDIRKQDNKNRFFQGIIKKDELFEFSMCNPPFYSSAKEAKSSNRKKIKSLNPKSTRSKNLNFGGQATELWTPGGEEVFIHNMIHESRQLPNSCYWFTTLVSKESILQSIFKAFRRAKVKEYKTVEMQQGNKKSRFVAWTFLDDKQRTIWQDVRLGK